MSRMPRTLQRIVYRHRNSLTRVILSDASKLVALPNGFKHLNSNVQTSRSSSAIATDSEYPFVRRISAFQKIIPQEHSSNDNLPEHLKPQNFIEFRTFCHPKIGLEKFRLHLRKYWSFVPKRIFDVKDANVTAIEFEHESRCPQYPRIVVSEMKYDHLSDKNQEIVQSMMKSIPEEKYSDPLKNENFLVTGTLWDPITLEDYESIQNESKFAALLSAFGIVPKHSTLKGLKSLQSTADVADAAGECEVSWRPAKFRNGTKMVLDTDHPLVMYDRSMHCDTHPHKYRFNTGFPYQTANNAFRLLVGSETRKVIQNENMVQGY
jgi:hypothetical protein